MIYSLRHQLLRNSSSSEELMTEMVKNEHYNLLEIFSPLYLLSATDHCRGGKPKLHVIWNN